MAFLISLLLLGATLATEAGFPGIPSTEAAIPVLDPIQDKAMNVFLQQNMQDFLMENEREFQEFQQKMEHSLTAVHTMLTHTLSGLKLKEEADILLIQQLEDRLNEQVSSSMERQVQVRVQALEERLLDDMSRQLSSDVSKDLELKLSKVSEESRWFFPFLGICMLLGVVVAGILFKFRQLQHKLLEWR